MLSSQDRSKSRPQRTLCVQSKVIWLGNHFTHMQHGNRTLMNRRASPPHTLRERAHHGQKAEMGPCAAGSRVLTRTFWLRSINGETVEGERGCNENLRYEGKAGKAPLKCVDPLSGDSGARHSFSDLPLSKQRQELGFLPRPSQLACRAQNPSILGETNGCISLHFACSISSTATLS